MVVLRRRRARAREAELHAALAAGPPLTWPPSPLPAAPDPVAGDPGASAGRELAVPSGAMPAVSAADALLVQTELMRLLESVTNMCEHVVELMETDRAERRLMVETLTELGRSIGAGATTAVQAVEAAALAAGAVTAQLEVFAANAIAPPITIPPARDDHDDRADHAGPSPAVPIPAGERVIGGSMPAGPDPIIDLRPPEAVIDLRDPVPAGDPSTSTATEIAVEVRGRFGDRWVDGFEICEVMTTPDGPRYRLRRHRDGVVLPELFDATNIRHVETFEQLSGDQLSDSSGYWSRS